MKEPKWEQLDDYVDETGIRTPVYRHIASGIEQPGFIVDITTDSGWVEAPHDLAHWQQKIDDKKENGGC